MEAFEFMKAVKQMRNDDIVIALAPFILGINAVADASLFRCMAPSSGGKDLVNALL
jgi:hypothetical protein